MNFINISIQNNFWIIQIFFTILATALLHAISKRILQRLIGKAEQTRIIYDEALLKSARGPSAFLIWLAGLCIAANSLTTLNVEIRLFEYLPQIKKLGIILSLTWGIISFIRNVEILYLNKALREGREVDKTLVNAATQLLRVSVIITAILTIMQILGLPISGLLAFGGIGGAGVAFASKDLLANFFGSLVIYMDRPFKIGDWIRSPDKNIEGTVEYIGWRVTRIRTFDKRPLYVPNGVFLTISVENPSRMTNRRIKTNIGIRYEDADKMDAITNAIKSMLMEHPEIAQNQTMIVNFAEFGPSSLNILVYTFTRTTNWIKFQSVQHDVFLKILAIIAEHRAECAFPTQTLHIDDSTSPKFISKRKSKPHIQTQSY